jgi:hypothetical protein
MGVIRGILLVFVVVLLFLSFFAINLFYTLSLSLDYNNFQRESAGVIKDFLKEVNLTNIVGDKYNLIQLYCKNNSDLDFVFSAQGYTFDIPCSVALEGENAILEEGAKDLIHNVYYKQYDCNFLDCFGKSPIPLFLVSEKTYNFLTSKLYWLLTVSLVLLGLSFLLIEKKTNLPILAGSLLIISSLPFFKLDYFFSLFSEKIIFKFLRVFFSQAYFVSIRTLIAGIVLLVAGIILDIFKIGFKISNFISKIKKKKEEIVKDRQDKKDKKKIKDKEADKKTDKKSSKNKSK